MGQQWSKMASEVVAKQRHALKTNATIQRKLQEEGLTVADVVWSDVQRSQGSSVGNNISDVRFAMLHPNVKTTADMAKPEQLVIFPAVRQGTNFQDNVTVTSTGEDILFPKVRTRTGAIDLNVSLAQFMKQIGRYITDLPEDADWSHKETDTGPCQLSNLFSVLPVTKEQPASVAITAFDYQCNNCHILISSEGITGWALGTEPGTTKVLFRTQDNKQYAAIDIAVETDVAKKEKFFKPKDPKETIAQEGERYKEVTNCVYYIQIELDVPRRARPLYATLGGGAVYKSCCCACSSSPSLSPYNSPFIPYVSTSSAISYDFKFAECSSKAEEKKEECAVAKECNMLDDISKPPAYRSAAVGAAAAAAVGVGSTPVKFDLAKVSQGRDLGPVADSDRVKAHKRKAHVPPRVTMLSYAVSSDADFDLDTLDRFCLQMSYTRRAQKEKMHFGSLVTGQGTWGGQAQAPIQLPKLPNSAAEIAQMFAQWPTSDPIKFAVGGPASVLAPGAESMAIGAQWSICAGQYSLTRYANCFSIAPNK